VWTRGSAGKDFPATLQYYIPESRNGVNVYGTVLPHCFFYRPLYCPRAKWMAWKCMPVSGAATSAVSRFRFTGADLLRNVMNLTWALVCCSWLGSERRDSAMFSVYFLCTAKPAFRGFLRFSDPCRINNLRVFRTWCQFDSVPGHQTAGVSKQTAEWSRAPTVCHQSNRKATGHEFLISEFHSLPARENGSLMHSSQITKCAYLNPQAQHISRQNLKSTKTSKIKDRVNTCEGVVIIAHGI
jgi:hypothetical protein